MLINSCGSVVLYATPNPVLWNKKMFNPVIHLKTSKLLTIRLSIPCLKSKTVYSMFISSLGSVSCLRVQGCLSISFFLSFISAFCHFLPNVCIVATDNTWLPMVGFHTIVVVPALFVTEVGFARRSWVSTWRFSCPRVLLCCRQRSD